MKDTQAARLARLYPRAWRERYGEEFTALLEEQQFSASVIANVLLGAIDAHARRSAATGWLLLEQRLAPWLWWVLAGMFGWAGLLAVMYAAFLRYGVVASNASTVTIVAHLLVGGVLAGAALGAAQWLLIRRYLPSGHKWVIATTIGWLIGAVLAGALLIPIAVAHGPFGWPGDTIVHGGVFGLVVGACVGVAQWRLLRREARHAGWWVLASAAGWGLGWLVGGFRGNEMLGGSDVGPAFHLGGVVAGVLLAPALGGALYALVTAPLLTVLLRAQEPLVATFRRRRPAAALTLAAALALVALSAGPAIAQARRPLWRVEFMTQWPAALVPPAMTPQPTVTAPRPTPGNYSTNMFVQTTVAEAQPHLPFHVLVPTSVPVGYRLVKALVPRGSLTSPKLPPNMASINLVYADAAEQGTWAVDAYPAHALTIWESSTDRQTTLALVAYPGTTAALTIGGLPAEYFRAEPMARAGDRTVIVDTTQRSLVLSRDGTMVTIHGWHSAGIDQTALEQLATSLH